MATCDKIKAGFDLCAADPIVPGIDDVIYLGNFDDFIYTLDPQNPLIITGITPKNGATYYKFTGTNNSFNSTFTSSQTNSGPRYEEQIDFNIAGNSTEIKQQLMAMGYGKLHAITINNYKGGDSSIELFGYSTGLNDQGSKRVANDETEGGGYTIVLKNRNKLKEPFPPRALNIPIFGAGIAGSPPLAPTSIQATGIPQTVVATGSATGGALAAATYYYKIVSVDAHGTTLGSSEVSYVATGSTSSVALTWAGAPGAVSYRIYKGVASNTQTAYYTSNTTSYTDVAAGGSISGTVPVVNTAITATAIPGSVTRVGAATGGILPAATYYYVVTSIDSQGETLASAEVSYTATGTTSSVLVEWGAALGASSYRVYRGTAAGSESLYFQTSALSFEDTGITEAATFASTLAALEAISV
ncbi:MAG: hypothetical protein JWQ57_2048 [Mucilaginibacter sp.]|nr:hypothetical protein [Mucilaginibacter sp.]